VDFGGLEPSKACTRSDAMEIGMPQAEQTNSISLCVFTSPTRTTCAVPQEGQWILLPWLCIGVQDHRRHIGSGFGSKAPATYPLRKYRTARSRLNR
jgi:hypothetical protein